MADPAHTPPGPLTSAHCAAFARDGFVAVERLLDQAEVERLRATLADLFGNRSGWAAGAQFDLAGDDADPGRLGLPQLIAPSSFVPELADSPFRTVCFDIAHQLLGGDRGELTLGCEHAIMKPAQHGTSTPWHQDEAYACMPGHDAHSCAIWMALQDATIENGCLWYVPGSHHGQLRAHRPIGGDPLVHGLETLDCDPAQGVPVPVRAGGMVIHHARTLHYAGPNRTAAPRFAYTYSMWMPSTPRATPHHMPHIAIHRPASATRGERFRQAQSAAAT